MLSHLKVFFSRSEYLTTAAGFFLLGFLFGNWASLIPYIKATFFLNDASLGLLLLCLPLGAMSFNPFAAKLIGQFGQKHVTMFALMFISVVYFMPFLIKTVYLLPLAMVLVGVGMTLLNISINMQASILEKMNGQFIMSTCHGMFSVGLMLGSIMRSFTLLLQTNEIAHMAYMVSFSIILGILAALKIKKMNLKIKKEEMDDQKSEKSSRFFLPSGVLLSIITISICINFTEGSMSDWASVYMNEIVKTSPYFVGWGLFGYSFFMALGRFFGDGIIPVYGRNKVLVYGAALSFIGILTAIIFPYTTTSILGFGMVGLGVSCGAPILYSAATRISGLTGENGLATMNFYAMGGFLVGPVVIGFISQATSLPDAFLFIGVLSCIWFYKGASTTLP